MNSGGYNSPHEEWYSIDINDPIMIVLSYYSPSNG